MSRYVVYESHQFEDDKCEMPDMDDFSALAQSIANLNALCNSFVSEETFETKIDMLNGDVKKYAQEFRNHKEELKSVLEKGQWKKSIIKDIDSALARIESRYRDINNELNGQIAKLGRVDDIGNKIDEKICSFQKEIQKGINAEKVVIKAEQDKINDIIAKIDERRKECEQAEKDIEQKYSSFQNEMTEEKKNREAEQDKINDIIAKIEERRNECEQAEKDIEQKFSSFQNEMTEEKKNREAEQDRITAITSKFEESRDEYEQAVERLANRDKEILSLQDCIGKLEKRLKYSICLTGISVIIVIICLILKL